ncbi:von Willebrand factor type A domain [Pelomyxa schiedti]|nr:von Willebrand factor type A domain [Pelomyxa schiedti]
MSYGVLYWGHFAYTPKPGSASSTEKQHSETVTIVKQTGSTSLSETSRTIAAKTKQQGKFTYSIPSDKLLSVIHFERRGQFGCACAVRQCGGPTPQSAFAFIDGVLNGAAQPDSSDSAKSAPSPVASASATLALPPVSPLVQILSAIPRWIGLRGEVIPRSRATKRATAASTSLETATTTAPGGALESVPSISTTETSPVSDEEDWETIGSQIILPVQTTAIKGKIVGLVTTYTITYTFANTSKDYLEVVFAFPVSDQATICGLSATIDGKTIVGTCQEKAKAAAKYDDAIASGNGAYLLEEDKEDILKLSLGCVSPGSNVSIELSCLQQLQLKNLKSCQTRRFSIPAKSMPGSFDGSSCGSLSINFETDIECASMEIESTTHPDIEISRGSKPGYAIITYSGSTSAEFALVLNVVGSAAISAYGEYSPRHDTMCLAAVISPDISTKTNQPSETELIFLVDRSGSMGGSKITQAKAALQLFLRSIPLGTLVNIIGFGSTHECMFPAAQTYSQEMLTDATSQVERMDADLGGTELLAPLIETLSIPLPETHTRKVIVITDGEVSDTDSVLRVVSGRENSERSTVFSLGIGSDCSQSLVNGLAKNGGGISDFVFGGERIETKVMGLLRGIMEGRMTDVQIKWGNIPVFTQYPGAPVLHNRETSMLYAFTKSRHDLSGESLSLSGDLNGEPFSFSVDLNTIQISEGDKLHCLGAREGIKELEHSPGQTGTTQEKKQQIIDLSCKYGVMSSLTSFICIEKRSQAVDTTMVQVDLNSPLYSAFVPPLAQFSSSPRSPTSSYSSSSERYRSLSPHTASKSRDDSERIREIQADLEEVKSIMADNIDSMLSRGEKLDLLVETEELQNNSIAFKKSAANLRRNSGPSFFGSIFDKISSTLSSAMSSPSSSSKPHTAAHVSSTASLSSCSASPELRRQAMPPPAPVAASCTESARCCAKFEVAVPARCKMEQPELDGEANDLSTLQPQSQSQPQLQQEQLQPVAPKPPRDKRTTMQRIVLLQRADGSWDSSEEVCTLLGTTKSKVSGAVPTGDKSKPRVEEIWATLLVIAFLQEYLSDLEAEWQMLSGKAESWAEEQLCQLGEKLTKWESAGSAFIRSNCSL